ncbi:PREDICTED: uncharacterized protein LOC108611949 [Drosophila arizonae]|uniref:Uncharacterized protein LOC108611949 n=1 Tax=Drosophila arizonae TaxID=7263 RepID=A0ABM1NZA7_DROAR|nr:PREDICTED: uncharacterized protein LOC108611949 [Drosophila arizonae]
MLAGKKPMLTPSFTKGTAFAEQVDFYSMEKAASVIIYYLFASKAAPFEIITKNLHEPRPGDEHLEEVWRDLITEHNRMMLFPGKRNLSQMQDELTTFYLNNLQLAFQAQLTNQTLNKSSKKLGGVFHNNRNFVLDIKQMPLGKLSFHHLLCDAQMRKLRRSLYNPDIPNMLKLLIAEELPRTKSTQELLKLYENDPQHYNVLLMSCDHNITHKGASLLNFIEHKFANLKDKLARQKRRSGLKLTCTNPDRSVNSEEKSASPITRNEFVLDDEYCREVREKWVKYFAQLEKTPTMLHLEEERRKKIERAKELKEERRLQRLELANSRRKSRPITALYTSPRLTHRMREAINRLAEEARLTPAEFANLSQSEPNAPSNTSVASREEYETGPTLADIILNSESMTSCCSKCRDQPDIVHYGPVLERFFRTHEEIIAHGNKLCNSPDEDTDFREIHYKE